MYVLHGFYYHNDNRLVETLPEPLHGPTGGKLVKDIFIHNGDKLLSVSRLFFGTSGFSVPLPESLNSAFRWLDVGEVCFEKDLNFHEVTEVALKCRQTMVHVSSKDPERVELFIYCQLDDLGLFCASGDNKRHYFERLYRAHIPGMQRDQQESSHFYHVEFERTEEMPYLHDLENLSNVVREKTGLNMGSGDVEAFLETGCKIVDSDGNIILG